MHPTGNRTSASLPRHHDRSFHGPKFLAAPPVHNVGQEGQFRSLGDFGEELVFPPWITEMAQDHCMVPNYQPPSGKGRRERTLSINAMYGCGPSALSPRDNYLGC